MYFHNWCRSNVMFLITIPTVAAAQFLREHVDCAALSTITGLTRITNPTSFCQSFLSIQTITIYNATATLTNTVGNVSERTVSDNGSTTTETILASATIFGVGVVTVATGDTTIITSDIVGTVTTTVTSFVTLQNGDNLYVRKRESLSMPEVFDGLPSSVISSACLCLSIPSPTTENPLTTTTTSFLTRASSCSNITQPGVTVTATTTNTIDSFTAFSTVYVPSTTITSTTSVTVTSTSVYTTAISVYDAVAAASIDCNPNLLATLLSGGGATLLPNMRPMSLLTQIPVTDMPACCNQCILSSQNCVAYEYYTAGGGFCNVWVGTTREPLAFSMQLVCPLGISDGLQMDMEVYPPNYGGWFPGACDLSNAIAG